MESVLGIVVPPVEAMADIAILDTRARARSVCGRRAWKAPVGSG